MSKRKIRSCRGAWAVAVLLGAGLTGCGDQGPEDGGTGFTSAIVYGTITRADVPAQGIQVHVTALNTNCNNSTGTQMVATTGPDGRYRAKLLTPLPPFTACISVLVNDGGTTWGGDGTLLSFLPDAGVERDSVGLDFFLP
jgi:hypothetical protein